MFVSVLGAPVRWLRNLVRLREAHPLSFGAVFTVVLFVALLRAGLELATAAEPRFYAPTSVVNNVAFYLQAATLYTLAGAWLTGRGHRGVVGVVIVGVYLGVLPPVLDAVIEGVGTGYYFYVPNGLAGWRWDLVNPEFYSVGEMIVLWLTVGVLVAYVAEASRSLVRTMLAAAVGYAIVVFISVGASTLAEQTRGVFAPGLEWLAGRRNPSSVLHFSSVTMTALQLLGAQVAYLALRPALAAHLARRLVHGLPFVALVFLGAAVSHVYPIDGDPPPETLQVTALLAALLFQLCVVALVQNDAFDAEEERNRRGSPCSREDAHFFTAVGAISVLSMLLVLEYAGMLLGLFFVVAVAYSYSFYRAKRWFPSNYKIEGIWAWSAFVLGAYSGYPMYLSLPPQVLVASALVFGGWSLFNVFKDYKDIRADAHAGHQTLYVLALRRGMRLRRVHLVLRGLLATCLATVPLSLVPLGYAERWVVAGGLAGALAAFVVLGLGPSRRTVVGFLLVVTAYVGGWAAFMETAEREIPPAFTEALEEARRDHVRAAHRRAVEQARAQARQREASSH